jgi:hypothetical protein
MDIKENFYAKLEQLNELREPKKPSKEHKKDVIDTTTKHSYKDYDDAHGKNVDARKKYMRDKTPESKDEVDRTEADRVKKGKRARILQRKSEKLKEGMMDWAKSKLGLGSSPDIRRMPDSKMDADVSKGINDYNNDQSEKEMSNAVKTTWMMSSNPTYKNRGRRRTYQDVDSNAKRETMRDKFIDKQNTRDIRRLNELRDETKAGYALKAADQITDYVANRTAYDASSEGEKKTKQLQKRVRGLQRLDRTEKKKKKIKAILKARMKKRSATRDIRRLNELRDETKAGYALKAADQITDYVANRTAYDASSEGEKKTKQLQKRIRGLQMLDRSEKKKKRLKVILKKRSKENKKDK